MGIVIRDALAVVPAGETDKVERHTIYIDGEDIVSLDKEPENFKADTELSGKDRLVIPGLVNGHTHTYMSMMRNYADDYPFADWLAKVNNVEDHGMTDQDAYWSSLLGQIEMIRSGTTTFNDQQMNIHMTTRAARESGMRASICRGLVGDKYDLSDRRLNEALEEMEDGKDCDRLTFFLGPHAPYTCGPDNLRMCVDVAREKKIGIHIHLAESEFETGYVRDNYNCTPIEYAEKNGVFTVPCVAAHCVQVDEHDIRILAGHQVSVVTNPASNMKLGNGFAPVPEMLEAGVNVALGTDGAASNNSQNLFREMSHLSMIHKGTHRSPQCVSAQETFRIATVNGARALGINSGVIEAGKKADLAILDLNAPSLMPNNNLIAALCYSAQGSEVETVIINGRIVMKDRELLTIDQERVYFEIRRMVERLGL